MADSKSCDKDEYLPPIFEHINGGKCSNKKNMIERRFINDVLPPDLKIKNKIIHVHSRPNCGHFNFTASK